MKAMKIVGFVLIFIGILVIAYDYIPPRREEHHIGIGPIAVTAVEQREGSNPIPLILGILSIVVGVYFVFKKT